MSLHSFAVKISLQLLPNVQKARKINEIAPVIGCETDCGVANLFAQQLR
jgi:hypothetical protein